MPEEYKKEGYGKRPLWQWVLIYLVIGGVVYGLIYFFVLGKNSGYGNSGIQQNTQQSNPY